jgi:hypothetical protein
MAKKPTNQTQSAPETTLGGKPVTEILALERGDEHSNSPATGAPGTHRTPLEGTIIPVEIEPTGKLTPTQRKEFATYRHAIQTGLETIHLHFVEVSNALHEIKKKKLYRGNYESFEEFCRAEFKMGAGQKSSFDYLRKEEPYFLFA